MSATTTPITVRAVVEPPGRGVGDSRHHRWLARRSRRRLRCRRRSWRFRTPSPPAPQLDVDGTQVADAAPAGDDIVFVRTEAVTYQLTWDLAQHMDVPDGSVIFDADGELVARVSDGELLSLVDG